MKNYCYIKYACHAPSRIRNVIVLLDSSRNHSWYRCAGSIFVRIGATCLTNRHRCRNQVTSQPTVDLTTYSVYTRQAGGLSNKVQRGLEDVGSKREQCNIKAEFRKTN